MEVKGRFSRQKRVSDKRRNDVYKKISDGTMPRMLDLTDVFEEIVDTFNDSAFTRHDFIVNVHELVFHVFPELCYEMNAVAAELLE
jgi:hypothetical protein